jgi:hypothetical protein
MAVESGQVIRKSAPDLLARSEGAGFVIDNRGIKIIFGYNLSINQFFKTRYCRRYYS